MNMCIEVCTCVEKRTEDIRQQAVSIEWTMDGAMCRNREGVRCGSGRGLIRQIFVQRQENGANVREIVTILAVMQNVFVHLTMRNSKYSSVMCTTWSLLSL